MGAPACPLCAARMVRAGNTQLFICRGPCAPGRPAAYRASATRLTRKGAGRRGRWRPSLVY